jgi:hypothetical protein
VATRISGWYRLRMISRQKSGSKNSDDSNGTEVVAVLQRK